MQFELKDTAELLLQDTEMTTQNGTLSNTTKMEKNN